MAKPQTDKEIVALLQLVDDPDQEVYETVAQKLLSYGLSIVPHLEALWEVCDNPFAQSRLENLIHQSFYQQLQTELIHWAKASHPSAFEAALIIAKFRFPEMDKEAILHQFELMRRNVWLELNNFLSPLEQINIINGILFNFFRLKGHELTDPNPNLFFVNHTVESKQGNAFTIGILYLALCEMLDVPIYAIDLPNQFILAYFDHVYAFDDMEEHNAIQHVQFFIDPTNGMVYNRNDIMMYLKKNGKYDLYPELNMLDSRAVITLLLENLATTYDNIGEPEKAVEIESLIPLIQQPEK
ncbi:hypothetical protein DBR32_12205 [Taibaiella sp. KBW10]|uniref:transglutaminase family protein n=1 Tax=Taibaiella sp. KBW10 TaxID=2153357 RepID=UPI000F5B7C98|nr:transglutaminase family protein [Taibaiella sp. KBW10]RQO30327.1 hypothetical protein DBR32_12205 [Taibaiella sp. KBW10]